MVSTTEMVLVGSIAGLAIGYAWGRVHRMAEIRQWYLSLNEIEDQINRRKHPVDSGDTVTISSESTAKFDAEPFTDSETGKVYPSYAIYLSTLARDNKEVVVNYSQDAMKSNDSFEAAVDLIRGQHCKIRNDCKCYPVEDHEEGDGCVVENFQVGSLVKLYRHVILDGKIYYPDPMNLYWFDKSSPTVDDPPIPISTRAQVNFPGVGTTFDSEDERVRYEQFLKEQSRG